MTIESITDSEWLLQHRPHASEEQEEAKASILYPLLNYRSLLSLCVSLDTWGLYGLNMTV